MVIQFFFFSWNKWMTGKTCTLSKLDSANFDFIYGENLQYFPSGGRGEQEMQCIRKKKKPLEKFDGRFLKVSQWGRGEQDMQNPFKTWSLSKRDNFQHKSILTPNSSYCLLEQFNNFFTFSSKHFTLDIKCIKIFSYNLFFIIKFIENK